MSKLPAMVSWTVFSPPFHIFTTVLDCRITQVYRSIATSQVESSPFVTSAGLLVYLLNINITEVRFDA